MNPKPESIDTAYLSLIEQIDQHLTRDTRHYRDNDGQLLLHLDQVVRAILADKLDQEKPMTTIFNFSHPLSEKTQQQITEAIGENEVHTIKVQLNLEQPIKPQIDNICQDAACQSLSKPDYIILPGLATAAIYIDRFFSSPQDDYPPDTHFVPIIWLKQEKLNEMRGQHLRGIQFILGGIE